MYNQISPYFQTAFSKFQSGFLNSFNAQHYLLAMVGKWCKTLDEDGETSSLFIDLSKAFDCIDYILLIAKLNAYGFEKQSINFIYSCLTKRTQRMKVDSAASLWEMLFSFSYICSNIYHTFSCCHFTKCSIGRAKYINITNGWIKQQNNLSTQLWVSSFWQSPGVHILHIRFP